MDMQRAHSHCVLGCWPDGKETEHEIKYRYIPTFSKTDLIFVFQLSCVSCLLFINVKTCRTFAVVFMPVPSLYLSVLHSGSKLHCKVLKTLFRHVSKNRFEVEHLNRFLCLDVLSKFYPFQVSFED